MPGKRITDHQVHKYKEHRSRLTQIASAAKAGISERSARRVEQAGPPPSQQPPRGWRTRQDPLCAVWDVEVVPLLGADAALNAVTLLEEGRRRHPGQDDSAVLRTMQRRARHGRALHGAEREVYFAQEHPPARLGQSDFTVCDEVGVQIDGAGFPHRLYQFALAHSGWRHTVVCLGGESFISLSGGLQAAPRRLGRVPEEHSPALHLGLDGPKSRAVKHLVSLGADHHLSRPNPSGVVAGRKSHWLATRAQEASSL